MICECIVRLEILGGLLHDATRHPAILQENGLNRIVRCTCDSSPPYERFGSGILPDFEANKNKDVCITTGNPCLLPRQRTLPPAASIPHLIAHTLEVICKLGDNNIGVSSLNGRIVLLSAPVTANQCTGNMQEDSVEKARATRQLSRSCRRWVQHASTPLGERSPFPTLFTHHSGFNAKTETSPLIILHHSIE